MKHLTTHFIYCIFAALITLLILTVGAAYIHLGKLNFIITISIAIAKAVLIILFFMEVRYRSRLIWVFAGAGFIWLFIMLVLTMADYASRHWIM